MTTRHEIPTGLVGINPRPSIGCHVSMAIRNERGTPDWRGRFFITTQQTHSEAFVSGGGKQWTALTRSLHGSFAAWNAGAFKFGEGTNRKGVGRFMTIRGNLIHARWQDSARWNRARQKMPEGHPNPTLSRNPACEGDGITAIRFRGVSNGEEVFERIACPNRECPFADQCKPSAHLIFRLRWDPEDPVESKFPCLIAEWTTRGWESLENMVGLFELVLGTEAILKEETKAVATAEQKALWKPGLAAEMGITNPSLVGLPFVMTVGEKTRRADEKSPGKRFPVVSFSPDGDLVAWLLAQGRHRRELSGMAQPVGLLPTVNDPEFLEVTRHESRVELDMAAPEIRQIPPEPERPGLDPSGGPAEVSGSGVVLPSLEEVVVQEGGDGAFPLTSQGSSDAAPEVAPEPPGPPQPRRLAKEARARIYQFAGERGLDSVELERVIGKPIDQTDLDELAILGKIRSWKSPAKGKRS